MLTMALTICSMIWETEVGTILSCPWKYPRMTPMMENTRIVGARTRSDRAQLGLWKNVVVIQSAPNSMIPVISPPETSPNKRPL